MRAILSVLLIVGFVSNSGAQDIATCGEPNGHSYYAFAGPIAKGSAGWQRDGIKNGSFTLKRLKSGKFDMYYRDLYGDTGSVTEDGATVRLFRSEPNNISVLVAYSGSSEIYTFWANNDGRLEYTFLQSKSAPIGIIKSALFSGTCRFIDFKALR